MSNVYPINNPQAREMIFSFSMTEKQARLLIRALGYVHEEFSSVEDDAFTEEEADEAFVLFAGLMAGLDDGIKSNK